MGANHGPWSRNCPPRSGSGLTSTTALRFKPLFLPDGDRGAADFEAMFSRREAAERELGRTAGPVLQGDAGAADEVSV